MTDCLPVCLGSIPYCSTAATTTTHGSLCPARLGIGRGQATHRVGRDAALKGASIRLRQRVDQLGPGVRSSIPSRLINAERGQPGVSTTATELATAAAAVMPFSG